MALESATEKMVQSRHKSTLSLPLLSNGPTLLPAKKQQPRSWDRYTQWIATTRFRTGSIILLGCTIFLCLHAAFGGLSRPKFQESVTIPQKIWQSWKVDPLRFEDRDIDRARSWTGKNPSHRYEVLTDSNAIPWVEEHYGPSGFNRPDIVSTYKQLEHNLKIIQADLLRYLIMYAEGGLWADIDVEAIKPIDTFIPKGFEHGDVQMVIGIETDEPEFKDHPVLGSKAQSFCQWTFQCKPRLPVMMRLIENILVWLAKHAQDQGIPISELHLDFDEVLSSTGPSAFTQAILKTMSQTSRKSITWDTFHDMTDSMLVGGVLVLPSEAFAAGTGHSKSGNHGSRRALVKHHFHASSWTTRHKRKKHPIYGEVERCNWDMECVRLWDANTAFFESLPEKDQMRLIGIKRLHDSQLADVAAEAAQKPMGLDPVPAVTTDQAIDLAAIARYLGQTVDGDKKDGEPDAKKDGDVTDKTEPLDLAAIDSIVQDSKKPVAKKLDEGSAKSAIESKLEPVEKGEPVLDLAAIEAALHGAPKGVLPIDKEQELEPVVKKEPAMDSAVVQVGVHGTTEDSDDEGPKAALQEKPNPAGDKPPPLDLAAIAAYLRAEVKTPAAEDKKDDVKTDDVKKDDVKKDDVKTEEMKPTEAKLITETKTPEPKPADLTTGKKNDAAKPPQSLPEAKAEEKKTSSPATADAEEKIQEEEEEIEEEEDPLDEEEEEPEEDSTILIRRSAETKPSIDTGASNT